MKPKRLIVALVVVALIAGGAIFLFRLRTHGFSARTKPMAFEVWLARHARDLATPRQVKTLENPHQATSLVLAEARDHFADHCAQCHGNNGDGKTMLGEGMFPPPPDLSEHATQQLSDGEIFNIIKEGIRFTGMPGFGGGDEDNWKLVLFVRHLPNISEKELGLMREINGLDNGDSHGTH